MISSITLVNTSAAHQTAFLLRSTPCKLVLTAIIALGVSCTPEQQATEIVTTFTTTSYAPQNRPDVRGMQGAVSSDHPLATQAGLRVLHDGGNATDAIIAMAGVLAVVRPHMNGIGGDAFGIFYDGETKEITALNASGRAGELATPEFFQAAGVQRIPGSGPLSVSVPGAVAGWVDAHARYGTMDLQSLLEPAVNYARNGFPVSTRLAMDFAEQGGSLNQAGRNLYLPGGSPPAVGSLLINIELADSLETVARDGKAGYYNAAIGEQLAAFITEQGGHLRANDFATHTSTWVDPLRGEYLDYTFLVMPPNTQGVTQLALMEMSKHHSLESMGHNSTEYLHTLIELKKLAFADRDRWVADPEHADVPVAELLDEQYLRERSSLVNFNQAVESVEPGFSNPDFTNFDKDRDDAGDTVYLTAVDQWGNAVSWIQSNFAGFGSGLLESQTGILLHNRGALFSLDSGHPNEVAPGKRPYHTLSPLMALYPDGEFALTMGTPGGDSQTQSLLQITHNMLLFGMTPQQAIEAPRFRSSRGVSVAIEDRVKPEVLVQLESLGHSLQVIPGWTATFGGAQMIFYDRDTKVLTAAADPRREAYSLAY
ncbi:MAG: gamma-glutamyltransferase [SAR86 cluster bacterium]|uniref:Glutathione hydrolase proenzyme n=1 Tax=SAR86 cluster bacterium TaxID=2030880 RepID=A0A2A4XAT0_9GAMM|nr:MAG: gamma-glutamyltransferase [SAR86 cluster bacterium]